MEREALDFHIIAANFRGFRSIDFDLKDVNFVVGDNSSGKTSLLYLIELLTSSAYVNGFELFSGDKIKHRNDVLSPYIEDTASTIGFEANRYDDNNNVQEHVSRVTSYLADKQGNLSLSQLTMGNNDSIVHIKRRGKRLYRKFDKPSRRESIFDQHYSARRGYRLVSHVPPRNTPYIADWMLAAVNIEPGNNFIEMPFLIPRPFFLSRFYGPIRMAPQAYYEVDEEFSEKGSHIPARLVKSLTQRGKRAMRLMAQLRRFGKDSGLFDEVNAVPYDPKDPKSPIKIIVKRGGKEFLIDRVGYGVSQILPILVEALMISLSDKHAVLIIQQPELHLHPRAQAAFGTLLKSLASSKLRFVVETHSDFIIDRFRYMQNRQNRKVNVQIVFCKNTIQGNELDIIPINGSGQIVKPPNDYRGFFLKEQDLMFEIL